MLAPVLLLLLMFQNSSNEPKPAVIRGTVTHAGSKTPIRKAKVTLTPVGAEGNSAIESGDDGTYELKEVKPGRYRLSVTKNGYEPTAYGARVPGESGQVVRVDAGAKLERMDVSLPKHGVIAGHIYDNEGEPVAKALVLAMNHIYYQGGRKTRLPKGTVPVMSNDLGEYRIGELPPGKYIVCAIPMSFYQPSTEMKMSKPGSEESVVTTCFPNLRDLNEATQIEMKDGAEIPGTDIRMPKAGTVTVQGQVTGMPAGAGTITLLTLNEKGYGPMGTATHPRAIVQSAEGKFEFKNVPPGSYVVHTLPTGLGNAPFVVKAEVEVGNQPVTDLKVPALIPFEVKAKVKADAGGDVKVTSVRVILTPSDEIISALAMGTANADGDLTLANVVPGRYRVVVTGLPPTHFVREIRAGEKVSEGDEVDVADASTVLGFDFGFAKGEVTGVVRDDKDEPVPGALVALIPNPRRPYYLRTGRADQNGVFKISNVPAGEYAAGSFSQYEAGALEDEEFVKPYRSKLVKVTVAESAQTADLKMLKVAQ